MLFSLSCRPFSCNPFSCDPVSVLISCFRSGNEMIKMAEVYFSEDKLEAAYILYMKFMTLHVEKLVNLRTPANPT